MIIKPEVMRVRKIWMNYPMVKMGPTVLLLMMRPIIYGKFQQLFRVHLFLKKGFARSSIDTIR